MAGYDQLPTSTQKNNVLFNNLLLLQYLPWAIITYLSFVILEVITTLVSSFYLIKHIFYALFNQNQINIKKYKSEIISSYHTIEQQQTS